MSRRHEERVKRFEFLLEQQVPTVESESPLERQPSTPDQSLTPDQSQGEFEEVWRAEELRRLSLEGIPDEPKHLRPQIYRKLLHLSPLPTLSRQYSTFLAEIDERISALPAPHSKGPLDRYDKLLREIERDVDRTFGTLAWFGATVSAADDDTARPEEGVLWKRIGLLNEADRQAASSLARSSSQKTVSANDHSDLAPPIPSIATTSTAPDLAPPTTDPTDTTSVDTPDTPNTTSSSFPSTSIASRLTRRQALLRPLFVYAFLNPGVSYVQGMSYLAAVFYYISANSRSPTSPSSISTEAATFASLGALLSQLRDLYVPTLDGLSASTSSPKGPLSNGLTAPTGLGATIGRFNGLLMWLDPNVADAMDRKGVEMGGIVMRWLTTVFANEFSLPDLVRIWDRVVSLYPRENETIEALSPIVSHLLDLALAIVITHRSIFISPYSNIQKMYATLQNPSIEGAAVDKLLALAWDIRERRLGRSATRPGTPTSKHTSIASDQGIAVGGGSLAGRLKSRLFSPSPATPTSPRTPSTVAHAADFELTETSSSVADSQPDRTRGGGGGGGSRFGSLAFSSPRSSSGTLANNVTMVEGKLLPPPPARMDEQETIASLVEAELASPEYGIDDDDEVRDDLEAGGSSFGGWFKNSMSRIASSDAAATLQKRATNLQIAAAQSASSTASRLSASDAAAQLSKAQTNLAIQAQLLRDRVAAEQLANRVREAGGRLMATTGSERGPGGEYEPRETPFTPPGGGGRVNSNSPSASPGGHGSSLSLSAPRPLLLSGSARRAQNGSVDEGGSNSTTSSPRASNSSIRSPSVSPVLTRSAHLPLLSPDLSIPPLSRSPSRGSHGRSTSTLDTPTRSIPASNFRPRSSSQAAQSPYGYDEDVPITSTRIEDSSARLRRGVGSKDKKESITSVPAENGRGWSLSDAPVRSTSATNLSKVAEDPPTTELEGLAIRIPSPTPPTAAPSIPAASPPPPRTSSLASPALIESPLQRSSSFTLPQPETSSLDLSFSSDSNRPSELPFSPPVNDEDPTELPFQPPSSSSSPTTSYHVNESRTNEDDTPLVPPTDSSQIAAQPSLSRGAKIVRRPVATKKRSSRGSSMAGSIDLGSSVNGGGGGGGVREERRIASEYLLSRTNSSSSTSTAATRRASRGLDGHRRKQSEAGGGGNRDSTYDEMSFLGSYGGEQ